LAPLGLVARDVGNIYKAAEALSSSANQFNSSHKIYHPNN
jgi:hypothetical protein